MRLLSAVSAASFRVLSIVHIFGININRFFRFPVSIPEKRVLRIRLARLWTFDRKCSILRKKP